MILTTKTDDQFTEIARISDMSFTGSERPGDLALRYQFDNSEIFVAPVDPMTLTPNRFKGYAIVSRDGGYPFLWSIATERFYRNCGIAKGLLSEIIGHYRSQHEEKIDLTVNVNNPAQKLYFDQGWRAFKVYPKYYGVDDGLRMRRIL